ncbi:MAG: flagellar assembly protein FliW [Oscillospiraceae bacterium]
MKLNTRDFGEVEIDKNDIITFVSPIYGFEEYKDFVFLFDDELSEFFVWLQSCENPELCFILADPTKVDPDYTLSLDEATLNLLGKGDCEAWLVTVISDNFVDSTANMRSPIIVNPSQKKALQAVLEDNYPIRFPFVKNRMGES